MESGAAAPAEATTVCDDDDGDDGVAVDDDDDGGGDDDDDEEKADETGNVISEKVVPHISCPASSRDLTGRQGCLVSSLWSQIASCRGWCMLTVLRVNPRHTYKELGRSSGRSKTIRWGR